MHLNVLLSAVNRMYTCILFKYLSENQWLHYKICLVTVLRKWLQNVTSWSSEAQGVSFLIPAVRHLPVPLLTSCPRRSLIAERLWLSTLTPEPARPLSGPSLPTLPMSFPGTVTSVTSFGHTEKTLGSKPFPLCSLCTCCASVCNTVAP